MSLGLPTETGLQENFARPRLGSKLAAREMGKDRVQKGALGDPADSIPKPNSQGWAEK